MTYVIKGGMSSADTNLAAILEDTSTTLPASIGALVNSGAGAETLAAILGDVNSLPIADRLTALANVAGRVVSKSITFQPATTSYALFTVSNVCAVKVIGVLTGALTAHADTTSVGTATSAAGLIAATAGTALDAIGKIWVDNAPSKFETFPANWALVNEDIVVASTANITGGVITFYCFYLPIVAAATVTAAP